MNLIIPIGPAGTGKTTYYETKLNHHRPIYHRISADEIRFNMLNYPESKIDFDPKIEYEVKGEVWIEFMSNILKKNKIYLDMCNLTKDKREPFIHVARCFGYSIQIVYFENKLLHNLMQNYERERKVGEDIIAQQFWSMEQPTIDEYDELIKVNTWKV